MTLRPMNSCMTRTTQRLKIIQRIVSALFVRSNPVAVNVVNVQIIFAAAALAGVIVAFKSFDAVATETVIVFSLLSVLLYFVLVLSRPFAYSRDMNVILARLALTLRPSGVFKRRPAVFAWQHIASTWRTNSIPFGSAVFSTFDSVVFFFATITRFLHRACRLVVIAAYAALPHGKAALCFPVSGKGARLASLCVRACSCYFRAAVRTVNNTVCFHWGNSKMIPDKYSGGSV